MELSQKNFNKKGQLLNYPSCNVNVTYKIYVRVFGQVVRASAATKAHITLGFLKYSLAKPFHTNLINYLIK